MLCYNAAGVILPPLLILRGSRVSAEVAEYALNEGISVGGREGAVVRMVVGSRGGREMRGLGEHRLLGGCIFRQILDVSPN